MATKTITIDLEAYTRLNRARKAHESFSQAIKRMVRPPFNLELWLRRVRENTLSPEAVRAIEQAVRNRRRRSLRGG